MVRRAWDLAAIGAEYASFVERMTPVMRNVEDDDQSAFAARSKLVHEWRGFLFRDPQLPPSLLPDPWPGQAAAAFFDRHATRLRPAADRFVDQCLREE
jgi:phenylacetic acid degradation operon negative regulatory protein